MKITIWNSPNATIIKLNGTSDQISLNDTYSYMGQIRFADGTVWDQATIFEKANTGSNYDDILYGTDVDNNIDGLEGNDSIFGLSGNDTIIGGDGHDELFGDMIGDEFLHGDDTLFGGNGDDSLSGGSGDDVMNGGADADTLDDEQGSDTYLFDRGWGQDTISDIDGNDAIQFTTGILPSQIQVSRDYTGLILTLVGSTDVVGIYNYFNEELFSKIEEIRFANGTVWDVATVTNMVNTIDHNSAETLVGSDADDTLEGFGGNDTLFGLGENDNLSGGEGDDSLDGGTGTDTMLGGSGNDTYIVDNPLDIITENLNEGTDTVKSSITISTLANNVEKLGAYWCQRHQRHW